MIKLRDYQSKAVAATSEALKTYNRVVVVAPTASGKSVIIAAICKAILDKTPTARVLVLCYIAEILEQNHNKVVEMGVTDSGIYCASLNRKDTTNRIIHASRDSLGRSPLNCGQFTVIIIDECHMLSNSKTHDGYYNRIVYEINPKYVIGFTGTPFRMEGGLIYGKNKFWEHACYEISMKLLIERGYLSRYILPKSETVIDTRGVKIVSGDFDKRELEKRTSSDEVINKCCKIWSEHGYSRRVTLFFCTSRMHAAKLLRYLKAMFPSERFAYVDGETNKELRAQIIGDARAGKYKGIINVNCLTTGTDIPIIDCIMWLRPTRSATLFVQGNGRGLRVYPGKKDCLIIDVSGNFDYFGTIEDPVVTSSTKKVKTTFSDAELIAMGIDPNAAHTTEGETPIKFCPTCKAELHSAARHCNKCGHIFFAMRELATKDPHIIDVASVSYMTGLVSKNGNAMMVIRYITSKGEVITEYLIEHPWNMKNIWQKRKILESSIVTKITKQKSAKGFVTVKIIEYIPKQKSNILSSRGSGQTKYLSDG